MRHIVTSGILLSSLFLPAAASASTPADDVSAPTQAPRVSTGVIEPTLLQTTEINLPDGVPADLIPANAQIGLTFVVDEKGRPVNIHVVKGFNPFWDARVVEAVSKFYYRPGTIDEKPIPIDMNLTVTLSR
jgi:hypothetical protein